MQSIAELPSVSDGDDDVGSFAWVICDMPLVFVAKNEHCVFHENFARIPSNNNSVLNFKPVVTDMTNCNGIFMRNARLSECKEGADQAPCNRDVEVVAVSNNDSTDSDMPPSEH